MTSSVRKFYGIFAEDPGQLPPQAAEQLWPGILERWGSLDSLFPELRTQMPRTFNALSDRYPTPVIVVLEHPIHGMTPFIWLDGHDDGLIASQNGLAIDDLNPLDETAFWLPPKLRAWYATTDGLQFTGDPP